MVECTEFLEHLPFKYTSAFPDNKKFLLACQSRNKTIKNSKVKELTSSLYHCSWKWLLPKLPKGTNISMAQLRVWQGRYQHRAIELQLIPGESILYLSTTAPTLLLCGLWAAVRQNLQVPQKQGYFNRTLSSKQRNKNSTLILARWPRRPMAHGLKEK